MSLYGSVCTDTGYRVIPLLNPHQGWRVDTKKGGDGERVLTHTHTLCCVPVETISTLGFHQRKQHPPPHCF